jgi:NitT/TauT family transport system substrate-binding protein
MSRVWRTRLVALAVAALGLTWAVGGTFGAGEPVKVRVGLIPVIGPAPLYVALEKGYFTKEGIEARIETFRSGNAILTQVAAGNLEVGRATLGSATLNAFARGMDVRVVASGQGLHPTGQNTEPLMVRKALVASGEVKGIADLKGKRCAINSVGTASEFLLEAALRKGGLGLDDITLVMVPFPDMIPAFERGAIDCSILPDPLATSAAAKGFAVRFEDRYAPGSTLGVLLYNRQFMEKHPEAAARVMVAYLKATRDLLGPGWASEDNVQIIHKWTKVAPESIRAMVPPYFDPDGRLNRQSLLDQQALYLRRKSLTYTTPLSMDQIIDERPLQAALKLLGAAR